MGNNGFSKATFGISICTDKFDRIILNNNIAFIKTIHHYPIIDPKYKIFMCKKPKGEYVTIRDLINCLIENKYRHNPYEYRYLEDFMIDEDGVVVPLFGS